MPAAVIGGIESAILLLIALACDALVSGWRPATQLRDLPDQVIYRVTVELDRRLNRVERDRATRRLRGAVVTLGLTLGAGAVGSVLAWAVRLIPNGILLELGVLMTCVSVGGPWHRMRAIALALDRGDRDRAARLIAPSTDRDPTNCDSHGQVRLAIEAGATALDRAVIAPIVWYLLLGLPGGLIWATVRTIDRAIGDRGPRHQQFGLAARRLDETLGFVPARLTGLVIALAALFVGGANPVRSLATIRGESRYHRRRNSGWPIAATAGALGLALGGPWRQGEVAVHDLWLGHGRARAGVPDLRRMMVIYLVAALLVVAAVAAMLAVLAAI